MDIKVTRTVISSNQETCWITLPDINTDLLTPDEFDQLVTQVIEDQCPEIDEDVLDTVDADLWRIAT